MRKIEPRESLLFHQDFTFPFFVKGLNDPLDPQAETIVIIDKVIKIV
ncbi:hypothetical protein DIM_05970 [Candidatus Denitrolinea symbiosum]|nr:hypothetical protein DIM_05970 [Candidatus Denitrolinea symbiosum]